MIAPTAKCRSNIRNKIKTKARKHRNNIEEELDENAIQGDFKLTSNK